MNGKLAVLGALAVASPIAVDVPTDPDTAETAVTSDVADEETATTARGETRLRIGGGVGSYAFIARGCEGQVIDHVPVNYREVGAAVEQRFSNVVVGVRGGAMRDEVGEGDSVRFPEVPLGRTVTNRYINPHIAFEDRRAGAGIGVVFHKKEFITTGEGARTEVDHPLNDVSGHIRIGHLDRKYFALEWMESVPLYAGGGYVTLGIGGRARSLDLYGGLSAGGPYEGGGLFLRASYPIGGGFRLGFHGRAGYSGTEPASGIGLGLEYRAARGRE